MEADVAVEIATNLEGDENVRLNALIMDDDSTTISRIRQVLPHDVDKFSDHMHTMKHIRNKLYSVQSKYNRRLPTAAIKYLMRMFSYALQQNKDNCNGIVTAISAIVPHAFGEHQQCGTWCKATDGDYVYRSLPNGKPLCGVDMKKDLNNVFNELIPHVSKIAPCYSTSQNESFNAVVASKTPKARYYSSSGSFARRVDGAVAQKNKGSTYLSSVFASGGLSPAKFYQKHAEREDTRRKRALDYKNNPENKKRRILFERNKSSSQGAAEVREGVTYQTAVDTQQCTDMSDIEHIPEPVDPPNFDTKVLHCDNKLVYFDIETTSFEMHCDIIQFAATYQQSTFNTYIMPSKEIDPRASQVTGLKLFKGKMYANSREVTTEPLQTALTQFLEWIPSKAPVLLVGHNCRTFDAPRLLLKFKEYNLLEKLCDAVAGFMDTLPLFKDAYKLDNYQQKTIVNHVLNETYAAHDALADCQALEKAMAAADHHLKQSKIDKFKYTFTSGTMVRKLRCDELKTQNLPSLKPLVLQKQLSIKMAEKAASSGLQMRHLELAFRRNEDSGINTLFAEINGAGKPRVTKDKKISRRVSEFFKSQMENWTHQTYWWLSARLQ